MAEYKGINMTKFFSPSTQGFYCKKVHKTIPGDSIEISDDDHKVLLIGQSKGCSISAVNGIVELKNRSTESIRNEVLTKLECDLHRYIFIDHGYPIETQTTIHIIASSDDSSPEKKKMCKSVLCWIQKDVLSYYYRIRDAIKTSHKPDTESWDFKRECDPSAPKISLSGILNMD